MFDKGSPVQRPLVGFGYNPLRAAKTRNASFSIAHAAQPEKATFRLRLTFLSQRNIGTE
jgi:hypothetical protein